MCEQGIKTMRRLLFIILISLVSGSLVAETHELQQLKAFADGQYLAGNHTSALKEYQRVLYFDHEQKYRDIYQKVASIYFTKADYEEALKYFDLAYKASDDDSTRFEIILKKGLCNLKKENYLSAIYELFDLPDTESELLTKKKNLYLGVCYFGMDDYDTALDYLKQVIDTAGIEKLDGLIADFTDFRRKFDPKKVERMSTFLPGLGQIYVGETFSGLNSVALLGAVFYYAVRTAAAYGYLDGLMVLSSWFYRYYSGGRNNASLMASKKISSEKSIVYSRIFEIVDQHEKQGK
jgi:tetratricopeptide (TPR) repeat protein